MTHFFTHLLDKSCLKFYRFSNTFSQFGTVPSGRISTLHFITFNSFIHNSSIFGAALLHLCSHKSDCIFQLLFLLSIFIRSFIHLFLDLWIAVLREAGSVFSPHVIYCCPFRGAEAQTVLSDYSRYLYRPTDLKQVSIWLCY